MTEQQTDQKRREAAPQYHWTSVNANADADFAARDGAGALVFNDRMWLLGGGTYDTPTTPDRKFHNEVWSTADGIDWQLHTGNAAWPPRQYHDVAVFDDRLWVMEGYHREGGNRNDVYHSVDGTHWQALPDTPWAPRHAASVFVYDDALWMMAGNNMEPDVWRLDRVDRK